MLSEKVIKRYFIFLCLTVISVNYLHSSELESYDSYVLPIPEEQSDTEKDISLVPYAIPAPGEFVDVDLPDEIKYKKQEKILLTAVDAQQYLIADNSNIGAGNFSIQVASFSKKSNAEKLNKKLQKNFYRSRVVIRKNNKDAVRYNVRFGHYKTRLQAEQALLKYKHTYKTGAYIVGPD